MRLLAEDGGLNISASKGIWVTSDLHVSCNDGKSYNLAEYLPKIISALGIS